MGISAQKMGTIYCIMVMVMIKDLVIFIMAPMFMNFN